MGTAHFTISGEFITDFFRTRLTEAGWQYAIKALLDSVEGITYDIAIKILSGTKRLVGDNEPSLDDELPETKEKWESRLQMLYAGTVFDQHTNSYWKPYAYVTNWGGYDLIDHHNKYHPYRERSFEKYAWGENRSCHYMNDPANDRGCNLIYENRETFVLWEEVVALPVWMNHRMGEWQKGLDDFCKNGKLQERGNTQMYGVESGTYSSKETASPFTPEPEKTSFLDEVVQRVAENTGLPLEAIKSTASAIAGTDNYLNQCGYIAPDGRFYSCPFHGHASLAYRLLTHIYGLDLDDPKYASGDPVAIIEKRGFLCISGGLSDKHYLAIDSDKKITADQAAALELWCAVNNEKVPSWANEFTEKTND